MVTFSIYLYRRVFVMEFPPFLTRETTVLFAVLIQTFLKKSFFSKRKECAPGGECAPCGSTFFPITKTRLFKYIENFTSKNLKINSVKNPDIFHISAKNIDCWYSLEPPQ